MRLLQVDDVENPLEGEFVEVETVAHVIVGGDGFGVVVNHDRAETVAANGVQGLHTAPVELDTGAYTVGTRAKHNDASSIVFVGDVMRYRGLYSLICQIEIVGLGRIFSCQRVYLLHRRQNAMLFAKITHNKQGLVHVAALRLEAHGTGNLEVGESVDLCLS